MENIQAQGAMEEQVTYANILEKGMYVGLALLVVTFSVYLFGILEPVVPVDKIIGYCKQDVHSYLVSINNEFLHRETLPVGWTWLSLLGKGDFLNFIGIAILSGISIVCYLAIVPVLLKKKDFAYAVMALLEVAILVLAASGLLGAGGH